jgi:hypothetical protein
MKIKVLLLAFLLVGCHSAKRYTGEYRVKIDNETGPLYSCGAITIEPLGNGTETVVLSDSRDIYETEDANGHVEYRAMKLGKKVFSGVHKVELSELPPLDKTLNPCVPR